MTRLENGAILDTDSYLYENSEWEDQLTSFNGKEITYDAIGNPLTIGNDIELTWINGRSLNTYSDSSKSLNVSYKYNNDGIRYEKTVNGSTTKYYLEGTSIVYEKKGTRTIYYLYDATGVIGLKYNDSTYLFEKSMQGDCYKMV